MRKVMLVGTNVEVLGHFKDALSSEYAVFHSSRGQRAIPLVRLLEPDAVVFLKGDGQPDFVRWIRLAQSHPEGRGIPIILMARKSGFFRDVEGDGIVPIPTLSIPILRAVLKGIFSDRDAFPTATRPRGG